MTFSENQRRFLLSLFFFGFPVSPDFFLFRANKFLKKRGKVADKYIRDNEEDRGDWVVFPGLYHRKKANKNQRVGNIL